MKLDIHTNLYWLSSSYIHKKLLYTKINDVGTKITIKLIYAKNSLYKNATKLVAAIIVTLRYFIHPRIFMSLYRVMYYA